MATPWTAPSAATLSIFHHLFASVAEEMGLALERAAYSPNIKERRDFSCALFLGDGRMLAQAAHIPVHLGAMPASVRAALAQWAPFAPGDVIILNDPYQGGNHLPDITLVSPVYTAESNSGVEPGYFVASRAHHADVGGMSPGSMPQSRELYQEGLIIPPVPLVAGGRRNEALWRLILRNVRTPVERAGDLNAQLAAHAIGARRLSEIVAHYGEASSREHAAALIAYAEKLTREAIGRIPDGVYAFADALDDDGQSARNVPIEVTLTIEGDGLVADFAGTAREVAGNLNAVPAIVLSAVAYCVRCVALALTSAELPMNEGALAPLSVRLPARSLLDPAPPHAVAAGNVETSQRIVDVVFGALAQAVPELIPAASQGTMNNWTFGGDDDGEPFAYYETIGGGLGGGPARRGGSGMHAHMSNTLNTPVEALEYAYPIRIETYALREGSGGNGRHAGGDGLVRAVRFLAPTTVTLTGERRRLAPYGLRGGSPGQRGRNWLRLADGEERELPGKCTLDLEAGDVLHMCTPGGGGWGKPEK